MCFRLFIILLVALWTGYLIRSALVFSAWRKEADEIIGQGDGHPERIERLMAVFSQKNRLSKRDKKRVEGLIFIRDRQIKGVKHVESKVEQDEHD